MTAVAIAAADTDPSSIVPSDPEGHFVYVQ